MNKSGQIRLLAVLMGLGPLSPSSPAGAADILLYPDTGPDRHVMPGQAVSECESNPATPQCAFDAWISCRINHRIDHCDAIGLKGMKFRRPNEEIIAPQSSGQINGYRIRKTVTVEEGDIPIGSSLETWLRPGDVELDYVFSECKPGPPVTCDWDNTGETNVFFQPHAGRWYVLAWTSEFGESECYHLQPPYDKKCEFFLFDQHYIEYVNAVDPGRDVGVRQYKKIDPEPIMQGEQ